LPDNDCALAPTSFWQLIEPNEKVQYCACRRVEAKIASSSFRDGQTASAARGARFFAGGLPQPHDAEDDRQERWNGDRGCGCMPMIPSTSDATQNPLLVPGASRVVPSIVNGMPQLLQLLAVIGLLAEQRGRR
jgi:hypothetical protein